jgi:hypothetical protein
MGWRTLLLLWSALALWTPRAAPPPLPQVAPPLPRILFEGGDAATRPLAEAALRHVFETPIGHALHRRIESGALGAPLTIELNRRGDNFTRYRIPGRVLGLRIAFDPTHDPHVHTERGLLPSSPETRIAHELGHAVLGLVSEEDVIRTIENPLREQLGLPRRSRF